MMCDKKDGHLDMTAHIFPQKRERHPPSKLSNNSFQSADNLAAPTKKGRQRKLLWVNCKAIPTSQFRTEPHLTAGAKTGTIFVKRTGLPLGDQIPSRRTAAKPS